MLNFILYNKIFDTLLLTLAYINLILNNNVDTEILKNIEQEKDNIETFKKNIANFYLYALVIFIFLILRKNNTIYAIIIVIITLKTIYDIYINIKRDSTNLSINNKRMYTFSTFLFFAFLSSNASAIYINNFYFISHTLKEILLITYLIIKTIAYLFLLLINFSIFISNIKIIFHKRLIKFISKMDAISNRKFELRLYDFYLYKKYNTNFALIIDKFIYIIAFPIYSIIILLLYIIINAFRILIKTILKILRILSNFDNNRDRIIKQILRIAFIVAFIIVYGITIYNKHIFSNEIIELYNLITTVILIPIIYDSIKSTLKTLD